MLPNKLQHGDSIARLFDLWNQLIDYLLATRLVAGSGIRINRLPAGTTIESTATATGGSPSAPASGESGTFDYEAVNTGTEENPVWKIRVYNSADYADTGIAGLLIIGSRQFPVDEVILEPPEGQSGYRYLYLDVVYDPDERAYSYELKISEDYEIPETEEREYIEVLALMYNVGYGKPVLSPLRALGNITVTGRWV